jgi:hypothetical protein
MTVTKKQLQEIADKLENGSYTSYFFLPDFEKPSGGIKYVYDHVKCMNENGFNAKVIHQKTGFFPTWLKDYFDVSKDNQVENLPIVYLDDGKLPINMEDFFFIPEGFPQVMENLANQNAPCKRIVFCLNWYYILNALPPGVFWTDYGINDCMSITKSQTEYIKMIMPTMNIKNVVGHIPSDVFTPPETLEQKKLQVAFVPSRDGGTKAYNVIKTVYALFPHLRFIRFFEMKGLGKEDYAQVLRESAFYVQFDEYTSWGTAPLEAFLAKCIVAGWDGVGGREYMNTDNMWIVPNGDILRLALAIGNMIETYMMDEIPEKTYEEMEKATLLYTRETERDSIITAHNEWRAERVRDIERLIAIAPEESEVNNG